MPMKIAPPRLQRAGLGALSALLLAHGALAQENKGVSTATVVA